MDNPRDVHDKVFNRFVEEVSQLELTEESTLSAMKALEIFSKSRPEVEPEPEIEPVEVAPATRWGRFKAGANCVWDNETTRVLIKAGGAFAGVALVAYSTIHKDHVLERQAMNQANQRNS